MALANCPNPNLRSFFDLRLPVVIATGAVAGGLPITKLARHGRCFCANYSQSLPKVGRVLNNIRFFVKSKGGTSHDKPVEASLVGRSPRQFDAVSRELDQVLDHVLTNGQENATKWCAPATLWEDEGRWCVEVDLPGVGIDDIDVTLDNSTLRLIAERQRPRAERKFFHQERAYGRIERIIRLPESVNPDAIEAELKEGVLRLSLAKRAELQPKKIQVKTN